MGPGAGVHGGRVMAAGQRAGRSRSHSPAFGDRPVPVAACVRIEVPKERREPMPTADAWLRIAGARGNNLKHVSVAIPVGLFTCVTGVSGSGKSTLVNDTLYAAVAKHLYNSHAEPEPHDAIAGLDAFDKVIAVDQSPIGRTPRSNPATYTGLFTPIRELFAEVPAARERGYGAGPLLVQRRRRPLRSLPGRRRAQGGNAFPARRLRALRRLPRPALQPRDARDPLQGQEHHRGARP